MLNLLNFSALFVFSAALVSCSANESEIVSRDYRIHVESSDLSVQNQFKLLVQDFNQSVGLQILGFEASEENATSPVALIAGLQRSTGKLGYGGVIYNVTQAGFQRERTASMKIELDMDYVRSRLPSSQGSIAYAELRLLFFHEVGHGLGFSHLSDRNDVMYQDLNGSKDFLTFYSRVSSIYDW